MTVFAPVGCVWHNGKCPPRQWIFSRQGRECAKILGSSCTDDRMLFSAWLIADLLAGEGLGNQSGASLAVTALAALDESDEA